MAVLVHLSPEKAMRSIRRSGILVLRGRGATLDGIYCMPVLPNYFISHQWLRELKRGGNRQFVAVNFRTPSSEPVWVGHYAGPRIQTTVGEAVRLIMNTADARGFEIVLPRAVRPSEILSIRPVSRLVGWRYRPDAHGQPPCGCPVCLAKGGTRPKKRPFDDRPSAAAVQQARDKLEAAQTNEDAIAIAGAWANLIWTYQARAEFTEAHQACDALRRFVEKAGASPDLCAIIEQSEEELLRVERRSRGGKEDA